MENQTVTRKLFFLVLFLASTNGNQQKQPHIVFVIADDLGWNDVGFHGSNQIPTPNIDALAYSGCILNRSYVNALCSPSRSSLLTGKNAIRLGTQHAVLFAAERRGLPLNETLLPQYLNRLGYRSELVGKWHQGHWKKEYTPTFRGFDNHLGYWTGHHDFYDHTAEDSGYVGLDMRRNMEAAWDLHGQYSTHIITNESIRIISTHNSSKPLFLVVSHAAVHSSNSYTALRAPEDTVAKFLYIDDYNRSRFAAVLSELDDSVGKITEALKSANMLDNTILVFTTDNGGAPDGYNINHGSNFPFRGCKSTLWEGGVRGAGFIWSNLLQKPGRVCNQLMHITDWVKTLYTAGGGNSEDIQGIDGVDQWEALTKDWPSKRDSVLHNIDDIQKTAALTVGRWKYITGSTYVTEWDGWYGPTGRDKKYSYSWQQVLTSPAYRAISTVAPKVSLNKAFQLREQVTEDCSYYYSSPNKELFKECRPVEAPCLFDVEADPCERNNLANKYPYILKELEKELKRRNETAVPAPEIVFAPEANPLLHHFIWTNFGDSDCE